MNRDRLLAQLKRIFGRANVLHDEVSLLVYEYDATIFEARPIAVVFPTTAEQLSQMVKLASREGIAYAARGAGTNLSGGSVPPRDGIVVSFTRMRRILDIDTANRCAVVEPGVVNLDLKNALAPYGLTYAPDPASQKASTLGGNVAENAGGPLCLKYGVTTNHILALEVVLPDGRMAQFGAQTDNGPGYDLRGLFIGAEGTLGLITKITVRLIPRPEAAMTALAIFDRLVDAAQAVSDVIALGIVPAALEMLDRNAIRVVEQATRVGYPEDADGALIIEVDGLREGLAQTMAEITDVCRACHAREVKVAESAAERDRLWAGRRGAFGALARLRPRAYVSDATVPRSRLPQVVAEVTEIIERHGVIVATLFHAGDGNLHPTILFDATDPEETERVMEAAHEISRVCVAAGGTITGEHGVGIEKRDQMPLVYGPRELEMMHAIKDLFDPQGLCNPEKVLPAVTAGA